jgi:hypothetical protein
LHEAANAAQLAVNVKVIEPVLLLLVFITVNVELPLVAPAASTCDPLAGMTLTA